MSDLFTGLGRFVAVAAFAVLAWVLWQAWKDRRDRQLKRRAEMLQRMQAVHDEWTVRQIARLPVREGTPDD